MVEAKPLNVVWVYDHAHLQHPFIVLGIETLIAAGHKVSVIAADDAPASAAYVAYNDFNFAARKGLKPRAQYESAFHRLRAMRADVIIASRPQAAIAAGLAAKLTGARFVYYPFELYGEQLTPADPQVTRFEGLLLRLGIDALITQNAERANVYRRERHARVAPVIVRNFKRKADAPTERRLRAAHPELADRRIVLYEGQLVAGRWLDQLVRAMHHTADDVVLVMMGPDKGRWLGRHNDLVEPARASGRLVIVPAVSQQELAAYVADADAGVIIYDDSVRNNVFCEPGKLSDYIAAGVPVIAPNFPTIAPLIEQYGLGACFDDGVPKAIAAAITKVLAQPKAHWAPNLARARDELTWESQTSAFLAAITGRR